jgi:hypothetical protein
VTPTGAASPPNAQPQPADATVPVEQKKKNPLQKFFGIFGDKKKPEPDKTKPDKSGTGDSP